MTGQRCDLCDRYHHANQAACVPTADDSGPLVKSRGKGGGRKPKGGPRIALRCSVATGEALDTLRTRWGGDDTAIVERAIQEAAGRLEP